MVTVPEVVEESPAVDKAVGDLEAAHEVLDDGVRQRISPNKLPAERWMASPSSGPARKPWRS